MLNSHRSSNYCELHASSAFSFLRGASQPEHLADRAASLGLPAIALCDRDGVYGSPRIHAQAREAGIRAIVGSELTMEDGSVLPILVESREGYRNLSQMLTLARGVGAEETDIAAIREKLRMPVRPQRPALPPHAAEGLDSDGSIFAGSGKRPCMVPWTLLERFSKGLVALTGGSEGPVRTYLERGERDAAESALLRLMRIFGKGNVHVELQRHLVRGEERELTMLRHLAEWHRLPLLATNGVLHASRKERMVLDLFTCMRHHTSLPEAGRLLARNNERILKPASDMQELFADFPEAVSNTVPLAERLNFSLENLGYEFPRYPVPEGETMDSFLHKVTMAGARARYSHLGPKVLAQVRHELALITKLGFSGYFLIVWDIANFCSANNILMQGRGSAANSVVCYCLGITACDPIACNLLFERFLSEGRKAWPDIDIDLPSGSRRESVIQEIYRRYGAHGAAMTANVITFRGRGTMREIGKALEFPPDVIDRFSRLFASGDFPHTLALQEQLTRAGVPPTHPRAAVALELYQRVYGLPRHLGQHSGGMIICQGALSSIVPLEPASMDGRVVAQWDKDDCEDLGIIKVDLLGLGMMSAMQDALELCHVRKRPVDMATIPKDDAATYEMMQEADTIGVFQIESRAQMATLPRLKPTCFYDVVVEVAIIRPGPIQGGLVHPYLARRTGKEPIDYLDDRLKPVLERTLGIPLFQEQLLKIAMVMADFTASEAEDLRRALSFHRSQERMQKVCVRLREKMTEKGVAVPVMDKIVQAVQSFAVYGFPESHAISFALIAYASAWMKVHRAAEFYCALLNNQPMGFYSPDTLLKDARRHGLRALAVNVQDSDVLCTVESDSVIRLGLNQVRELCAASARKIVQTREMSPYTSLPDFQLRTGLPQNELRALAGLGAFDRLPGALHRRDALWNVELPAEEDTLFSMAARVGTRGNLLAHNPAAPATPAMPSILPFTPFMDSGGSPLNPMTPAERLAADYATSGLSIGPHPMVMLREQHLDLWRAADLRRGRSGMCVRIGGMVICRQRPGTAKGFVFVSLEDESGIANAILTSQMFEAHRLLVCEESFLIIQGTLQIVESVIHVRAQRIEALRAELAAPTSHDFH